MIKIHTVDVVFNENEILNILNIFEFALYKGYRLDKENKELINNLLTINYVIRNKLCYPLLFDTLN